MVTVGYMKQQSETDKRAELFVVRFQPPAGYTGSSKKVLEPEDAVADLSLILDRGDGAILAPVNALRSSGI